MGSADIKKTASVRVIRNKKSKTLMVRLENLPEDEQFINDVKVKAKPNNVLGMTITNLGKDMRNKLGIKQYGVLVKSVDDGVAFKAGLRAGDVVMQFAGININNTEHFKELVEDIDDDKFFSVLINRQGNPIFLALKK